MNHLPTALFLVSSAVYAAGVATSICDVSTAAISLPSEQTNISQPSGMKPKYVAAGLGTQNYTCLSSGTYTYVGAMLELIDISCLVSEPNFTASLRKRDPSSDSDIVWQHEAMIRAQLGSKSTYFGYSYNQNNPSVNSQAIIMFDFRSDFLGNDNQAFTMAYQTGSLVSNSTQNFPWLQWDSVQQGDLASRVYSINTYLGQPPAACQPGSQPIQVRYGAEYWFYTNNKPHSVIDMATNMNDLPTAPFFNSSDIDSGRLETFFVYAPIFLGLLSATTALSLTILVLGIIFLCMRRGSSNPTRSAAFRPIRLPCAKEPMVNSYHNG